nr:MAG TPA: hypothetical protein [Caudoviricetes sp.]
MNKHNKQKSLQKCKIIVDLFVQIDYTVYIRLKGSLILWKGINNDESSNIFF